MRYLFVAFMAILFACQQQPGNVEQDNALTSVDSNAANGAAGVDHGALVLQTFSDIPDVISGCSGLFIPDTASPNSHQYVFAHNLKGTAFIKLNGRLIELNLVRQTNPDEKTIYELYTAHDVEVDLKVQQVKQSGDEVWDYQGVLVIRRGGENLSVGITGKLGC